MRIVVAIASVVVVALLAACAGGPARNDVSASRSSAATAPAKPRPTTDDYRRYIRGSVSAFNSSGVTDWDSSDPNHVVVWTSPAEAYLLTLFGACFGLDSATTILLAADGGVVRPGAAAVMIGAERCRIQFVDKLDARAIKADGLR
jgi:uncharacterized protein DUF6491